MLRLRPHDLTRPRRIALFHRLAVSWLAAGALLVGAGCSPRPGLSQAQLGKKVATRNGNVVTVYGWQQPALGGESDSQGSGLRLESCRTRRNGLLLDAGNFTVRTARGAVVPAGGSNFTADGDCVRGKILFDVPAGDEPRYVLYRAGRKVLRWSISPNGSNGDHQGFTVLQRAHDGPWGTAPLTEAVEV